MDKSSKTELITMAVVIGWFIFIGIVAYIFA